MQLTFETDAGSSEGHKTHGCSVHVVDNGVDTGPLIAQASAPVMPGDEPEILAARVLEREHVLYPWVVNSIGSGDILIRDEGSVITYSEAAVTRAAELKFKLFP